MSIILNKMEDVFESSSAKSQTLKKYRELKEMHENLQTQIRRLRMFNDEALKGQTKDEIDEGIRIYENKLRIIKSQLSELKASIGGGY